MSPAPCARGTAAHRLPITLSVALFLSFVVALPSSALAEEPTSLSPEDDARARELYENGAILYEEGRYEDAIAAWNEAYRLSDRALLLFNMANALERLGRYDEAMTDLSRYRAYAPAEERETLDRRIRNLGQRIDEQRALATSTAATSIPAQVVPRSRSSSVRVLPLALGGVGLLGAAGSVAFGLDALAARREAASLCIEVAPDTWCGAAAGPALTNDKTSSLLADIGMGVGALGVGGAVITALLPGRAVDDRAVYLGGGAGPDGGLLRLGGHF